MNQERKNDFSTQQCLVGFRNEPGTGTCFERWKAGVSLCPRAADKHGVDAEPPVLLAALVASGSRDVFCSCCSKLVTLP